MDGVASRMVTGPDTDIRPTVALSIIIGDSQVSSRGKEGALHTANCRSVPNACLRHARGQPFLRRHREITGDGPQAPPPTGERCYSYAPLPIRRNPQHDALLLSALLIVSS